MFVHIQSNVKTFLFQTIQFSISSFNFKTVLFQEIQFCISTHFSFIWPRDKTLSGATTLGQSGPGSDGNEGVIHISQSSSITGASPPDYLVSYSGHSLWRSYLCRDAVGVFYSSSQLGKRFWWNTRLCKCNILYTHKI